MSIWKYADRFSDVSTEHQLSLGEGHTPLVRSRSIGPTAGLENLFFKLETVNPSGSYKDRFAAAAISHMRATGKSKCVATSSGNTGSALAAYCAAARMPCQIAIVETAPQSKLTQMLAYGAQLLRVRGFGTESTTTAEVFQLLADLGSREDSAVQISAYHYSPEGMYGVQTIGYELAEQTEGQLQHIFCQAGGGGLTLATARAIAEASPHTKVHCVQPSGNDTIAGPLREGLSTARAVQCTTTISGLQVASVVDGNEVVTECRELAGTGYIVEDTEVYSLQRRLAREEGIFCEPAGAVALAGALQSAALGELPSDETAVCLITGSGFKDSVSAEQMVARCECPLVNPDDIAHIFAK